MSMKIFISYRREDSIHQSGRIHEWLCRHFGKEDIFFDVDSIPPGANWKSYLDNMIGQCDVLLVPIGDQWLTIMQERADQTDMVRYEIEAALRRGIPIIPLQVGNAPMPDERSLPDSIHDLTAYQGVPIRPGPDFRSDMSGLIEAMEREFGQPPADVERKIDLPDPPPLPGARPPVATPGSDSGDEPRSIRATLLMSTLCAAGSILIILIFARESSESIIFARVVFALIIFFIAASFLHESKIVVPFSDRDDFVHRLHQFLEKSGYSFRFKLAYRFPLVSEEPNRLLLKNSWGRIVVVIGEDAAVIVGHAAAIQKFSNQLSKSR